MITMGEIIKTKRIERGLSQRQLAEKVGVAHVMVCHWEHGYCLPNILNCWDLADFFGCTLDELCGRTSKGDNNE